MLSQPRNPTSKLGNPFAASGSGAANASSIPSATSGRVDPSSKGAASSGEASSTASPVRKDAANGIHPILGASMASHVAKKEPGTKKLADPALTPAHAAAAMHADDDNDDAMSTISKHTLKTLPGRRDNAGDSGSAFSLPGTPLGEGQDDNERLARDAESAAADALNNAELARQRRKTLLEAGYKLFLLFVVCAGILAATLYFVLPEIDDNDRQYLRIPRSFEQLKDLNSVLQRYKDRNFARVMICWVVLYMFLQAFSIPGSMYMSILAGAMWGVALALPIVCASVATGATICYLISAFMGEAVLGALPKWKARVDAWKDKIQAQDNLLSYLIVIRMMPLPPHNVVNLLAPHLGIQVPLFWLSTFFGIFAVSVIHTTIGEKLDQMTSSADFNLISVRNAVLMCIVIAAALTPILVKRYTRAGAAPLEEAPVTQGQVRLEGEEGVRVHPGIANGSNGRNRGLLGRTALGRFDAGQDSDELDSDGEDDELPRVSLRDAVQGRSYPSRRNARAAAESNEAPWRTTERDVDDGAYASEDENRFSRNSSGAASPAPSSIDERATMFDDRLEEGRLSGHAHNQSPNALPRPAGKAAKLLGYPSNPQTPASGTAEYGATSQGIGQQARDLWGKVTGGNGR
ncbi:hypothetical protein IE81DRAFT_326659 [Ceraceosorus guamensis]|uniref:VTT domain-containing protein n=1 Tax=Ceraceosorus guamensis TaxID=1522189 RepID=A0A316VNX5_9BASI|nr:hypothetical protein IE81DRAFT_326659 [Ceraceosorus guamensis]PWN39339.1 hypothetical protein IE81DRAFT_326659 [Ceraceosorus guamensis]